MLPTTPSKAAIAASIKTLLEAQAYFQAVVTSRPRTFLGQSPLAVVLLDSVEYSRHAPGGRQRDRSLWTITSLVNAAALTPEETEAQLLGAVDLVGWLFNQHAVLALPAAVSATTLEGYVNKRYQAAIEGVAHEAYDVTLQVDELYNTPISD